MFDAWLLLEETKSLETKDDFFIGLICATYFVENLHCGRIVQNSADVTSNYKINIHLINVKYSFITGRAERGQELKEKVLKKLFVLN